MLLSNVTNAVTNDLEGLASLGDDQLRRIASQLSTALEPSLRARFLEAINELVADLNGAESEPRVEIRLAGDDVSIVWRQLDVSTPPASDLKARVALRLPDDAKSRIEDFASGEGVSVNAWIVRALQGALEKSTTVGAKGPGRSLRGTGRS
jgi:hypothetical protein